MDRKHLTPEQKQRLMKWWDYLFSEEDDGFDADWDQWVWDTYQKTGSLHETLCLLNIEDRSEALAVIHTRESKQDSA
jgi:hypothetical protein